MVVTVFKESTDFNTSFCWQNETQGSAARQKITGKKLKYALLFLIKLICKFFSKLPRGYFSVNTTIYSLAIINLNSAFIQPVHPFAAGSWLAHPGNNNQ